MPTQLRYIGTTNPLFETAITGKPSMWRPGRTSDVPDADVPALLASGLFEGVDLRDRDTSVPISAALVSTPTADMLSIASRDVTYIGPDGTRYRSNATESAVGTALVVLGVGGSSHLGTAANESAMVALTTAVAGSTCTRTDTGTVWILKAAPYSTASNWQDTGNGETLPQYAISGATSITRADHCNRVGVNSTASNHTLTIQTDALGGYAGNEIVYGFQGSTGTVTIAGPAITLQQPTGSKLTTTSAGDYVSAQRIGVDTWAITSVAGSASSGGFSDIADSVERRTMTQFRSARVQNAGGTTVNYINQGAFTTRDTSTAVSQTRNTSTPTGRMHRMIYRSAANAINRAAGVVWGDGSHIAGVAVSKDAWPLHGVVGINDASPTLGTFFFGLLTGTHTVGQTALSGAAANNYIGVGCEDGDANLSVLIKDDFSSTIKIDMGATWARSGLTGVALAITVHRNDAGTEFYFRVKNLDTDAVYTRTVTSADGTLPTSTAVFTQIMTRESCASAFQAELLFAAVTQGRPT